MNRGVSNNQNLMDIDSAVRRDTAFTDPAYDFGLLYRDLGPAVLDASLEAYSRVPHDEKDQIRRRAHFFGRWRLLENIAYGLEPQHSAYFDAAMRSLR
jgi:hypothetical protein